MKLRSDNIVLRYVVAILGGLLISVLLMLWQGVTPDQFPLILQQAIFSPAGALGVIRWSTPLILVGLSFAIASRSGMFNIGIQGQAIVGALVAAVVGIHAPLPPVLAPIAAILAGALAGALWAYPAEVLRRRLEIDEVITTLLMNYIAILGAQWVVNTWLYGTVGGVVGSVVATDRIRPEAQITRLSVLSDANVGIIIAVMTATAFAVLLARWPSGYALRAIGANPKYAEYAGVPVPSVRRNAFLLAGAMAGIMGAIEVTGIQHRFVSGFEGQLGIEAIMVSIIGANHPLGVLLSGPFFAVLKNVGLVSSQLTTVSSYLITLVTAVFMLMFVADPVRTLLAHRRKKAKR